MQKNLLDVETRVEQKGVPLDESQPPLFYNAVVPLTSSAHQKVSIRMSEDYSFAVDGVTIPLLQDELIAAQKHYPVVFTDREAPSPVALTGFPDGKNQFVNEDGRWRTGAYVPAYVRRYPFVLAKVTADEEALNLCFDPSSQRVESNPESGNLFENDEPTQVTKQILGLCERFEASARRTQATVSQIDELGLLIDGQASVQSKGGEPSIFRGFRIVSEEKLLNLADEDFGKLTKTGAMLMIYAHLFSLQNITGLFGKVDDMSQPAGEA